MRVDEALRLLAQPGVVGDELPAPLADVLWEAQLGRVERWPQQGRVAVLLDDLWAAIPDASSAVLVVDGVTSVEIPPDATPFVGSRMHFMIGVATVHGNGSGVVVTLGAMADARDVRIDGARALLVTLADRTGRDDAAPSTIEDLQGYLDWSLDLDREVDVLGWYEVRPER
ncbi:hypothetical protein [Agrococcus jejuensis]|uniref:Uncharacterized protein n=1 Tax=Agrococcus jejuensis TaxID=399736 RepID=A0A1G8DQV5_9MICO|nr:hypothetical protein [Agrococcus jejuensis]SDH60053.1 hypothetical protein SAMN04489720_1744 [Agrococcus jejuensis]